jgi:hypothetical protein
MQLKNYLSYLFIGVLLLLAVAAKAQKYGSVNAWFDTDSFLYNNYSGAIEAGPVFLLPDSGAYWINSKGVRQPINTFAAGHLFDVAHELWAAVPSPLNQSMAPVGLNCPFTWDSLQFQYFYERNQPDTTITDTLFIYYYHNFAEAMLKVDTSTIDGDSFLIAIPQLATPITLSGQKHFRVDTVLLTQTYQATIDSQKLFKTAVNVSFSPNPLANTPNFDRLLGFNIVYKPGFKINAGDTVFVFSDSIKPKANIFGAYFYRIPPLGQGPGTPVPLYYYTRHYILNSIWWGSYDKVYANSPGFISSWNFYAPTFFSSAAYITSTSCPLSVNQPTKTKGTFIKSVSPNPVKAGNNVVVEVNTSTATQLKVQLRDVLGNLLLETEPKNVDGEDFFKINIAPSKGVYFALLVHCQSNTVLATSKVITF